MVAVEDRGRVLELLGSIGIELQGDDPLSGGLAVVVARETSGGALQVGTGHGHGTQDVLNLAGVVAGGVGLIRRAFDALDVNGGGAVQRQEVEPDLLGDPCQVRGVGRLARRRVRKDAVAVLIRDAHRGRLVEGGGLHLGRTGLGSPGLSAAGSLTRLSAAGSLTRLSTAGSLTRLATVIARRHRRGLLVLDHALSSANAQHRTEVHLRGRTNEVQLRPARGCRESTP